MHPPQKTVILDGHVYHDRGLLWNHETNFGLIGATAGAPYPWSGSPSARWPGPYGEDNLYAAGLWVGAIAAGRNLVTTGTYDFEFWATDAPEDTIYTTAEGAAGGRRFPWPRADDDGDGLEDEDPPNGVDDDQDGLVDEDFAAIGDQHFRCAYADTAAFLPTISPDHESLGIRVVQESFQWERPGALGIIGYDFTVRNVGYGPLEDLYLGLFADFDVGVGEDSPNDDLAGTIRKTVDLPGGDPVHVNLVYTYDDWGCFGFVLCGYSGLDVCGEDEPALAHGLKAFSQGDPATDAQRYAMMASGGFDPPSALPADYRTLISCGPFAELAPGQNLRLQVAMIAAADLAQLIDNAALAVRIARGDCFDRNGDPADGTEFHVPWLWGDYPSAVRAPAAAGIDLQVGPNPFNPAVTVDFALPSSGRALVEVFDLQGRRVRTLLDENMPAGEGRVTWRGDGPDGRSMPSGVYLVRVSSPSGEATKQVTLVR